MRKFIILATLVALALVLVLGSSPALAAFCINADKPDGAGNIGWVLLNPVTFALVDTNLAPNPGGQIAGGFVDIYLDTGSDPGELDGGDLLLIDDTFLLPNNPALGDPAELPSGAHNAGPGNDKCDGIGVDEAPCP